MAADKYYPQSLTFVHAVPVFSMGALTKVTHDMVYITEASDGFILKSKHPMEDGYMKVYKAGIIACRYKPVQDE